MGILLLNNYGKYLPRRRVIEGALITLGVMLGMLSVAGPISRLLQRADEASRLVDLSALTSLLAIVVFIAFIAGVAYGMVAIPSQTQLQEDLPEEVRGRVFGILNMIVSVSSFLPIIIVGPLSDFVGTSAILLVVAIAVLAAGIGSVFFRDPSIGVQGATADPHAEDPFAAALGMDLPKWREDPGAPASRLPAAPATPATPPARPVMPRRAWSRQRSSTSPGRPTRPTATDRPGTLSGPCPSTPSSPGASRPSPATSASAG